jgi:aspartyl protease family protein
MDVGGFEARNVEAAIIPEGLGISLLGQSYLSRIDNVEISDDEMRLGG